jgi:hypothetical protein
MLSTAGVPLWMVFFSTAALFFSICACAISLYSARRFRPAYPPNTLRNAVRAEIDARSGDIADLTARFSRFQKREGMREAREAKKSSADLQAEALAIVGTDSSPAGANHPKADLYKRARGH